MTDETRKRGFRTTLSHIGRAGPSMSTASSIRRCCVAPPVLVPTVAERQALQAQRGAQVLTYGTGGSATHWALEDAIAAIEGGTRCYIVSHRPGGGDNAAAGLAEGRRSLLMPDHVYGPARIFASGMLTRLGVETTYYPPEVDEAGIAALMRPNTKVVYTESPGSHTFEVQDVPAIARAAHARRRQGADGQHLGHPSLPAVPARRRCLDPGGDEISRRAIPMF